MTLTQKEVKGILVAQFMKVLPTMIDSENVPTLDSKEYSDLVKLAVYCRDIIGKPQYFAGISVEPLQDLAKFWTDYDTLIDVLESQDSGHNWKGMYGPKTVRSDMMSSLGRVAGANAKADLETWALNRASNTHTSQASEPVNA